MTLSAVCENMTWHSSMKAGSAHDWLTGPKTSVMVPSPADRPLTPCAATKWDAAVNVLGPHLRAARALLGWAMSDLARVSGLSLSTIRRLEQNAQSVSVRNHRSAVEALQAGGVRFFALSDGTVALAGCRARAAPSA